ncbi:hypothetical protein C358_04425 [Cryptococcus neoformans MW-RSA852]|nr:hypothetical protein C358_04425 [Cryptococcus neoformans var. grubii MW-RSA852]
MISYFFYFVQARDTELALDCSSMKPA